MRDWVDEFLNEINKIEDFYTAKLQEYNHEFEILKEAFHRKKHGKRL
jgi:hypothetical protein